MLSKLMVMLKHYGHNPGSHWSIMMVSKHVNHVANTGS